MQEFENVSSFVWRLKQPLQLQTTSSPEAPWDSTNVSADCRSGYSSRDNSPKVLVQTEIGIGGIEVRIT
ncbi:hypothetical protein TWF718_009089 [Orbilia javanica]|uniref:Uncharacterized protein n=1 Tax=Orbilia javanica TaxID=47235 RepID=A0AAN8RGS0_9PEZI